MISPVSTTPAGEYIAIRIADAAKAALTFVCLEVFKLPRCRLLASVKVAIKCRIRSAVTQAKAAVATPLHL